MKVRRPILRSLHCTFFLSTVGKRDVPDFSAAERSSFVDRVKCCGRFLDVKVIPQQINQSSSVISSCTIYIIIIHQTHSQKSDWSRALNQFTIACELDMINVSSAADITFIMSSSTSAWLLSRLECSPQKQNG